MIHIKLQYDKYNRTFKLVDREFGSILEDGAVYEVSLPLYEESLPIIVSVVSDVEAHDHDEGGRISLSPPALAGLS